ncbi:MAG: cysteine peptidase family C39 domain-containing protein [Bacilli bacterium]
MKYFIKQLGDKDCGFTCVKMLLAMTYKRKDFLFYQEPSIDSSASLRDLMLYAKKEGLILGAFRMVNRDELFLNKVISPILIPILENNMMHMVLVKKIKKNKCQIYDPSIGVYYLNKKKLLNIWNGEYLEVIQTLGSDFTLKKIELIPKRMTILTMFFEILSFGSLIAALYFIDGKFSFYVSLSLFVSYIVFEFIYRKILIQSMKYFDNHLIVSEFALNHHDFKTRYADMTQFKILAVSNPIQLLSLIMMTIFGIVVLGINSPFNLLSIGMIILFQIIFKVFEKYTYEYKRNKIDTIEKNLNYDVNIPTKVFVKRISALNYETYRYVSYCNLKRYIMVFLIIALSLLYVNLSEVNSLNFMLFHFFFYLYLNENFEKILNFSRNYDEYQHFKALYLYYFNKY